jgi:putative two-component system response regulator
MDGSGYPHLHYPRSAHYVSRLVQVCDVFSALRSARPYRPEWPLDIILSFLAERSGFEFHPALVTSLTGLIDQYLMANAAA